MKAVGDLVVLLVAIASVASGAVTGAVVRVADHGAAGDGRSDDGAAFSNAVVALRSASVIIQNLVPSLAV